VAFGEGWLVGLLMFVAFAGAIEEFGAWVVLARISSIHSLKALALPLAGIE
jgi:hypothetical protein